MAERWVRTIAVGNRVNVAAWRDDAHATAEIERIVALGVPFLAADRPNLLVLSELLGLPGALMGRGGMVARRLNTAQQALTALAVADARNLLAIRRRFAGISLPRALLLSHADALYRPLAHTLPRLAQHHHVTIVAGTAAPLVERSTRPRDIRRWGQPDAPEVFLAAAPEVYNVALVATPEGTLHRVHKVFPTESERALLDIVPGKLEDSTVIDTPAGRLGVAISLDAFTPAFLHHIDALGAEIVAQPDANDQLWPAPSKTWAWQPQEWLNSVLGSVQPEYPHLQANVCAMQTGNFFDITFDGQSTIVQKGDNSPQDVDNFVGNSGFVHTVTGQTMTGRLLAVAPWVIDDPLTRDPSLTLAERRAQLHAVGQQLLPGQPRAGQFREVAIWADLLLTSEGSKE
jgi:predicted amidohydrolase